LQHEVAQWIEEHPTVEGTYVGILKPASQWAPSLYNCFVDDTTVFGISFSAVVTPETGLDQLRNTLKFMTVEKLSLPDFEAPEGWQVTLQAPVSQFKNGEEDQTITIESFDGSTLCWTVDAMRFFAVAGNNIEALNEARMCPGRPLPEGSYFQYRQGLRGTFHFQCTFTFEG